MFEFRNDGRDQLLKAMGALPRAVRNRMIRAALRAGGQVVKEQAVANVKAVITSDESKGLLERSIIVRSKKQRGKTLGVVVAIGQAISHKGSRVGLYGSVLELGKENQPPRPWLRPAAQQKAEEVNNVIARESAKRLDEAVEAAKKGQS